MLIIHEWECVCGSKETASHEGNTTEKDDIVYSYCSECGSEAHSKVGDCMVDT